MNILEERAEMKQIGTQGAAAKLDASLLMPKLTSLECLYFKSGKANFVQYVV